MKKILRILLFRIIPPIAIITIPLFLFLDHRNTINIGSFYLIGYPICIFSGIMYIQSLWQWRTQKEGTVIQSGWYRFTRNPQYLGAILVLLSEALIISSGRFLIFTFIMLVCLTLLIIFKEEPEMRKRFGNAYEEYCKKTNRWITFRMNN